VTGGTVGRLVVVTDRVQAERAGHRLPDVAAAAVDAGAPGVLLREKDLPAAERRCLAEALRAVTARRGAALWVASDAALARDVGADGVHLAAADPAPDGDGVAALPWGRSCHGVEELRVAAADGAAWATCSPVFATDSKPGYGPALGVAGLAAACRAVPGLPVLALGGIGPGRVAACLTAGAAGVATMGAVMRAEDPAAVVRRMLDEAEEAEVRDVVDERGEGR
jgi:thiamine-phosphate diphosphorylase